MSWNAGYSEVQDCAHPVIRPAILHNWISTSKSTMMLLYGVRRGMGTPNSLFAKGCIPIRNISCGNPPPNVMLTRKYVYNKFFCEDDVCRWILSFSCI